MENYRGTANTNEMFKNVVRAFKVEIVKILNPIQTGGSLTPPQLKSFITHKRLRLQCSYSVTFPQIYLQTIWCC